MNKRLENNSQYEVRMMNIDQLRAYLGLGRNKAMIFAKECGAEKRVGRRCLYDVRVIDQALDELEQ